MMIKTYTDETVRNELRSRIYAKYKNITAAAPDCGVSRQYLCGIVNRNYPISDNVLKYFGMEKKVIYLDRNDDE